jgi:acetoin utilization deacetylase AcuC-like enzyme
MTKSRNILEIRLFPAVIDTENLIFRISLIRELSLKKYTPFAIVANMATDSPLSDILKRVYNTPEKYNRLIDRVVKYSNEYLNYSTPAILERRINKLKNNQN